MLSLAQFVDQKEDDNQVLRVLPLLEQLRVLVDQMTDLGVRTELRLVDDTLDRHIDVRLPKGYLLCGRDTYELAIRSKSDWVATFGVQNALLVAPLVELDVLLFLLDLLRTLPIDLKLLSISRQSFPLDVFHVSFVNFKLQIS